MNATISIKLNLNASDAQTHSITNKQKNMQNNSANSLHFRAQPNADKMTSKENLIYSII